MSRIGTRLGRTQPRARHSKRRNCSYFRLPFLGRANKRPERISEIYGSGGFRGRRSRIWVFKGPKLRPAKCGEMFCRNIFDSYPKNGFLSCQVGTMSCYLLLGCSASLPLLFLSRVPTVFMAVMQVAQSAIAQQVAAEYRSEQLGRLSFSYGIGMVLGSPLGGFLAGQIGYWNTALFAAAVNCVLIGANSMLLPKSLQEKPKEKATKEPAKVSGGLKAEITDMIGQYKAVLAIPGVFTIIRFRILMHSCQSMQQSTFQIAAVQYRFFSPIFLLSCHPGMPISWTNWAQIRLYALKNPKSSTHVSFLNSFSSSRNSRFKILARFPSKMANNELKLSRKLVFEVSEFLCGAVEVKSWHARHLEKSQVFRARAGSSRKRDVDARDLRAGREHVPRGASRQKVRRGDDVVRRGAGCRGELVFIRGG